jgi:hypothetical protein
MALLFSPSAQQFYLTEEPIPDDAAPVTLEAVRQLLGGTAWQVKAGAAVIEKAATGSVPAETLRMVVNDTQDLGEAFLLGASFEIARVGGSGHREAATARVTADGAAPGEFLVGFHGNAHVRTGAGNVCGLNGYAWVDQGAEGSAEAVGAEMNTDVRRDVVRKVGLHVIDAATSTGCGTREDAGVVVAAQVGAAGYSVGLKFGANGGTFGVRQGGTVIYAEGSASGLRAGLDLSAVQSWSHAPVLLRPGVKGISWGAAKEGGAVVSETVQDGGELVFGKGKTVLRQGGHMTFQSSQQDTYLTARTGADGQQLFRRVIAGAPDSAGTGYRTLKVEN